MAREKLTPGANGHLTVDQVEARTGGWTSRHFQIATPVLIGLSKVKSDRAPGFRSLVQAVAAIGGKRERIEVARQREAEARGA